MPPVAPSPAQTRSGDPQQAYHDGLLALQQGNKLAEATRLLEQAYAALPTRGDVAYNYGVALQQSGQLEQAIAAWDRAATLSPQHAVIWSNLALAQSLTGRIDDAKATYNKARTLHPANRDLLYNEALLLHNTGALEESLRLFEELGTRHPNDQPAWINAGKTAKSLRDYAKAERFYDKALALDGPYKTLARFNRANLLLLQGRWKDGFAAYESRLDLPDVPPAPWGLPVCPASPPRGTRLLVWSDQGFGDALMYLRFVPELAARGYDVSLFVQKPLKALLANTSCVTNIFTPDDAPAAMDAALALGSLPFFLDADPATSWKGPYLRAPASLLSPLPARTGKRRIGLVWAGNAKHENDRQRSLDPATLAPLVTATATDTEWFSLQLGPRGSELRKAGLDTLVRDVSGNLTDFAASAAVLQDIDLLISVDTAAVHLAGALGKPVWTLLPAIDSDWRWGLTGTTCFWYPSMRLWRQTGPGAWTALIEEMGKDLQKTSL